MNLWYIGFFDSDSAENRNFYVAAVNKMRYIANAAVASIGRQVEIISVARTNNKRFYTGRRQKIGDDLWLRVFPTIPNLNWLTRRVSSIFTRLCLFFYLLSHVQPTDQVIVYHSVGYGNAIHWAKKLKKFRVILEVEEIYQDVKSLGKRKNRREYRDIQEADGYIFSTELLDKKLNTAHKPHVFIYGTYHTEKETQVCFIDNKIHAVYAGTFSAEKGGAQAAIAAAEYLPDDYHVHILGFGTAREVQAIQTQIQRMNENLGQTRVTYEGLLEGEEYIRFLQKCQIGLSTQTPEKKLNDSSFPSKILSYMANGLRVVTIRIPAVEVSAVSKAMYYYTRQRPEEIARAIQTVDLNDSYDSRKMIRDLDKRFREDLKTLLQCSEENENESHPAV